MGGIVSAVRDIANSIGSLFSYLIGIVKGLWFGLTSLISGLGKLVNDVFEGGVFDFLGSAFGHLQILIGTPGVIFFTSLFVIIIFRIGVAFVFKIFRLNVDYKPSGGGGPHNYTIYNIKTDKK